MTLSTRLVARLALVVVVLIAGRSAPAQQPGPAQQPTLGAGQRVRVKTESQEAIRTRRSTIIGTYTGRVDDKLLVTRERAVAGATPDTIPLFLVQQVDVSAGMHSRAKLIATGAAIGGVVSLGAYALIHMLPALCGPSQPDPCPPGQKRVRGLGDDRLYAIPIALGVLHGALVPREKWKRVVKPSLSLAPSGTRGLTIAFQVATR
jgi:hypothetical protein